MLKLRAYAYSSVDTRAKSELDHVTKVALVNLKKLLSPGGIRLRSYLELERTRSH